MMVNFTQGIFFVMNPGGAILVWDLLVADRINGTLMRVLGECVWKLCSCRYSLIIHNMPRLCLANIILALGYCQITFVETQGSLVSAFALHREENGRKLLQTFNNHISMEIGLRLVR